MNISAIFYKKTRKKNQNYLNLKQKINLIDQVKVKDKNYNLANLKWAMQKFKTKKCVEGLTLLSLSHYDFVINSFYIRKFLSNCMGWTKYSIKN